MRDIPDSVKAFHDKEMHRLESLALLPGGKGGYSVKLVDLNRGDHEPVGSGRGAVLIVDDEDMVRLVCRAMVQGLGYSTMVASDGA